MKEKTTRPPKKVSGTAKSAKTSTGKKLPDEEQIREKAREIYIDRIAHGKHGTAEDDWREAEEFLMR